MRTVIVSTDFSVYNCDARVSYAERNGS